MESLQTRSVEILALIRDLASFEGEDRGPRTHFLIWNFLVMTLGAVGVREYRNVKLRTMNKQSWATWAALVSSAMLLLSCVLESRAISLGHGKHASTLSQDALLSIAVVSRLANMFVTLSIFWSKLFVVSVLQPNVPAVSGRRRTLDAVIGASALGMAVAIVLASIPVDGVYCPTGRVSCVSLGTFVMASRVLASFSVVLNVVLVLMAASLVARLSLEPREKTGAAVAITFGACAIFAALIKRSKYSRLEDGDVTYHGAYILLWSVAEATLTTIAGTFPSIRPYMKDTSVRPASPPPEAVALRDLHSVDAERGQSSDTELRESEVLYRSMVRAGLL
ncbi:hypothetical protein jhhlp_005715 [Lomentospora prolificans]|uniref:Rhodopsin domain-containing protein n=1 Tax=Lomentospora prolificans TaxID=41688 RepID=A0A2N3N3V9_9PEZI|nr:hypothetical protein jhhlp_005715 [Lomentospora prolificans]